MIQRGPRPLRCCHSRAHGPLHWPDAFTHSDPAGRPARPLPRLFDYLSPEGDGPTVAVGCRLKVPFGNRELVGVVVGHGQTDDGQGLRQALAWCDPQPLLQGELWQSLQWLARYTHAPLGEVLSTALPGPLRHGEALPDTHHWGWQLTAEGRAQRENCAPAAATATGRTAGRRHRR
jgi:primosomal protein N'